MGPVGAAISKNPQIHLSLAKREGAKQKKK
jgi:hypothetical protein